MVFQKTIKARSLVEIIAYGDAQANDFAEWTLQHYPDDGIDFDAYKRAKKAYEFRYEDNACWSYRWTAGDVLGSYEPAVNNLVNASELQKNFWTSFREGILYPRTYRKIEDNVA